MELLGVVASYMQVYDETKSLDPAEAKEARKKALETLIDSATDRRERGRDVILSLGSNVGFSSTWSTEQSHQFALRVPLSLSLQYLPNGSGVAGFRSFWGLHVGVQVADLGQFIRPKGEGNVTWSSFVAPGLEVGFLFGQPNRTFALTGHISYAPTLTDDSKAAWRGGISLSYYVPFFDLNSRFGLSAGLSAVAVSPRRPETFQDWVQSDLPAAWYSPSAGRGGPRRPGPCRIESPSPAVGVAVSCGHPPASAPAIRRPCGAHELDEVAQPFAPMPSFTVLRGSNDGLQLHEPGVLGARQTPSLLC